MSVAPEWEPIQKCVISLVLTLRRALVDLIQIEKNLTKFTANYGNYRKQLHIALTNWLPSFVSDDFPDLKDLLVSKLMKDIEQIQKEIDEILDVWMQIGQQILDRSQTLKSTMNGFVEKIKLSKEQVSVDPPLNQFFLDDSLMQFLQTDTPASFSPVRWYELGIQLSSEITHECKCWNSVFMSVSSNEPLNSDLVLSVPKTLDCVWQLQKLSECFSACLEFNSTI